MFGSAAEEISHWAERCRIWAIGAPTREQRLMLHSLEMILGQAADDAQLSLDFEGPSRPAPTKS
jgi:hypothetical protein